MEDVSRADAPVRGPGGQRVDLPLVSGLSWPGVRYFSTTRMGGVSRGAYASFNLGMHTGDDPARVRENRSYLRGLLPADPLWLDQVHGGEVLDADSHEDRGGAPPKADAAVTTRPECVLAIMTADCLPVVLADVDGTVLGVAHAGWRGLAGSVLEHTVERLRALRPNAPGFRAWIGPAISQRCFEVGSDVYAAFVDHDAQARHYFVRSARARGKWLADLASLARHRLTRAGVEDVELSGYCTYGQPERFYSYRRASDTGRGATIAWLLPRRA
ncbi:MAG: peptidoglycan editing factor PgeF [Candidimonas sp.]|nr:MAG: peptidoglycan editing factor PgeF [Candidimonas sp.]